jgi:hypothetical protein
MTFMKCSFSLPQTSRGNEVLGHVNGRRVALNKAGKELIGQMGWHSMEEIRSAAKYLSAESAAVSCDTFRGWRVAKV